MTSLLQPAAPLVLDHLRELVSAATSSTSPATLHPYAPLPSRSIHQGTGKARGTDTTQWIEKQQKLVKELQKAVDDARAALSAKDGDWGRLSRSLREIVTNRISPISAQGSFRNQASASSLPDPALIRLQPVELLQHLATKHDIQTYLEDSPFGLLKTSLTLAGNCFVVDIDLETDPVLGANGEVDGEADAEDPQDEPGTSTSAMAAVAVTIDKARTEGRGRVRVSRLTATHVTAAGGTGKSDYLAAALLRGVNAYLEVWNEDVRARDMRAEWARTGRLARQIDRLDAMLDEIKGLDESEGGFVDLEEVAKMVDRWYKGDGSIRVFEMPAPRILPSFTLLRDTAQLAKDENALATQRDRQNVILRMRPARQGENVPTPFAEISQNGQDEPMSELWPGDKWLLETVRRDVHQRVGSIMARRGWLGAEVKENIWDRTRGPRVEDMLFAPHPEDREPIAESTGVGGVSLPTGAVFEHRPGSKESSSQASAQAWSLGQPGPEAFALGRIGLRTGIDGVARIIEALRSQIVLNLAFCVVFNPTTMRSGAEQGDDGDGVDLDTLLQESSGLSIDVTLEQQGFLLTMPLAGMSAFSLRVGPIPQEPYLQAEVLGDVLTEVRTAVLSALSERKPTDLVDIVRVVEEAVLSASAPQ